MKDNKIKIFFVIPTLSAGGAERIMAFLSKNIDSSVFDSTLCVIGPNLKVAYDITNMKIKFLKKSRVLTSIPNLIQFFFKEKPQIVMSSIGHLNVTVGMIAFLFPKIIFIGRQSGIIKISRVYSRNKNNFMFDLLNKIGLKKLDYVICQSSDMLNDCKELYGIKEDKLKILNNPITDSFRIKNSEDFNPEIIKFITVGRLTKVKGHDRILGVLSNFKSPFIYTIIGDGPEKERIKRNVKAKNIKDYIKFINYTDDVAKYLMESDFFLQGSYAEGFPNALLESCAVGTPVIAFDAPGGTREIVENNINGFIVNSEEEFIEKIMLLKNKKLDPKTISESVTKKYSKEVILAKYEELFINILK